MKEPKKRRRGNPPPTPGGKALERLHQFELERGLEETDITQPKPDEPLAEKEQKEKRSTKTT